ncbi:hypothetical protein EON64_12735 [archaeon]|nr:MAG: hypothetical protein EON64_12735 [archaeon]
MMSIIMYLDHTGPRPGKLLQYIRVNILREYLVRELLEDFIHTDMYTNVTTYTHITPTSDGDGGGDGHTHIQSSHTSSHNSVVDIDPERVLDDFIFLSFFVGNDFLPQLPGLSIGESAFDIIFDAYKTSLSGKDPVSICIIHHTLHTVHRTPHIIHHIQRTLDT